MKNNVAAQIITNTPTSLRQAFGGFVQRANWWISITQSLGIDMAFACSGKKQR